MSIKYETNLIKDRLQEFSDYWIEQINNVITGKAKPFDEAARDGEYWNDLRDALLIPANNDNNNPVLDFQHGTTTGTKIDVYSNDCKMLIEQKKAVFDTDKSKWSNTIDKQTAHNGITPLAQAVDYIRNLSTNDAVPLHVAVCNYNMIRIYDTDTAKRITAGKARTGDTYISEFTLDEFAQHEDDLKTLFNVNIRNYNATRLNDTQVIDTSRKAAVFVQELKTSLKQAYENDLKYLKSYDPITGKHAYDYNDDLAKLVTIIVFAFYADDAGMLGGYNKVIDSNSVKTNKGFLGNGNPDYYNENNNNLRNKIQSLIVSLTQPDYVNNDVFNTYKYNNVNDEVLMDDPNNRKIYKIPFIGNIFNENDKHDLLSSYDGIYIPHNMQAYGVYDKILRMAAAHSNDFHWRDVDAVMFGSMMEGMFSHDDKISNGIYWTPRKYIHMVIDPVFIHDKTLELDNILNDIKNNSNSVSDDAYTLDEYINSLADYRIMDPACGSGNFLTETYLTMRRLENKALKALIDLQGKDGLREIRVKPSQFYGIEINDYACIVARMSMAIAETRALQELKELIPSYRNPTVYPYFPITGGCTIVNHNALTDVIRERVNDKKTGMCATMLKKVPFDWSTVMPLGMRNTHDKKNHGDGLTYDCKYLVIGNPPFIGDSKLDSDMSDDLNAIYGLKQGKTHPRVDYCSCWYIQAANYLHNTKHGEFSFVSTANICKGEQPRLWFDKLKNNGWFIQTAWKSFKWSNDSHDAAPAVIIVHFNTDVIKNANKYILTDKSLTDTNDYNDVNDYEYHKVNMINRYLESNDDLLIHKKASSLSEELKNTTRGNMPSGESLIINDNDNDYDALMSDKVAQSFIRKYIGAEELKNGYYRHCIWITNENDYKTACQSAVLKTRFDGVREQRLNGGQDNKNYADKPYIFARRTSDYTDCNSNQLVIPRISGNAKYMQCGYVSTDVIISDACFTCLDETGLNFSVIETRSFMKWQSYLGGSLFGATRFANTLTWNNYPLPSLTDEVRDAIINAGKNILAVRDGLTDSKTGRKLTLNEMYKNMPPALQTAHSRLDLLVDSVIHDYIATSNASINDNTDSKNTWMSFIELLITRINAYNDTNNTELQISKTMSNDDLLNTVTNNANNNVTIENLSFTDDFIDLYGSDAVYSDDDRIHDLLKAYVIMTGNN